MPGMKFVPENRQWSSPMAVLISSELDDPLLFSAEYRRFNTGAIFGAPNLSGQVGLAVGFLF